LSHFKPTRYTGAAQIALLRRHRSQDVNGDHGAVLDQRWQIGRRQLLRQQRVCG